MFRIVVDLVEPFERLVAPFEVSLSLPELALPVRAFQRRRQRGTDRFEELHRSGSEPVLVAGRRQQHAVVSQPNRDQITHFVDPLLVSYIDTSRRLVSLDEGVPPRA